MIRTFIVLFISCFCSLADAEVPVRPLDGRAAAISPQNQINRTPGTTVRVVDAGQTLRTLTTAIPIKLPREVLRSAANATELVLNPSTQSLVIDPDNGEWYSFVDRHSGYSISVEGDNRLAVSQEGCTKARDRNVYVGPTYTLPGAITDRESGPKKEILVVADCVPYRALLECDKAGSECEAQKNLFKGQYVAALATILELNIPRNSAPRALFQVPASQPIHGARRPQDAIGEFQYHEPGRTLIRQYIAPDKCGEVAKGEQILIDRRTPYSRLVFAGPDLIKRFPVVLPEARNAVANSQIFGPGGGFYATSDGVGRSDDFLPCAIQNDGSMGLFGEENKFDARNFEMPWADTFCEWRGNSYTQPFCAASGQLAMKGPHFGVDIRSWSTNVDDDVPIVSASDGIVVEVDTQRLGDVTWAGFVVKIRSQHLIFVYRHMKPDKSPFRHDDPNHLALGDRVAAGQLIGYMGKYLDGPNGTTKHLHFEIEAPVPKAVLLGPACLYSVGKKQTPVRVCTAREKAPPFATLIVAYFAERYGYPVPLGRIDGLTGLPSLPVLQGHEITPEMKARVGQR